MCITFIHAATRHTSHTTHHTSHFLGHACKHSPVVLLVRAHHEHVALCKQVSDSEFVVDLVEVQGFGPCHSNPACVTLPPTPRVKELRKGALPPSLAGEQPAAPSAGFRAVVAESGAEGRRCASPLGGGGGVEEEEDKLARTHEELVYVGGGGCSDVAALVIITTSTAITQPTIIITIAFPSLFITRAAATASWTKKTTSSPPTASR